MIGKVGSSLAFGLLFKKRIDTIILLDTNKTLLEGEYTDLGNASFLLRRFDIYEKGDYKDLKDADKVFICAGFPRKRPNDSMDLLYIKNKPIISNILKQLKTKGEVYLITNPVEKLAKEFNLIPLGLKLDLVRQYTNQKYGNHILKNKGYTNWGIVVEAIKRV